MATTIFGNDGSIEVSGNAIAEITEFEHTRTNATVEDTSMGDSHVTRKPGINDFSGSISFWYAIDDATGQDVLTVGAQVTLKLYPEGNTTGKREITAPVIISEVSLSQPKDNIVSGSISYVAASADSEAAVA